VEPELYRTEIYEAPSLESTEDRANISSKGSCKRTVYSSYETLKMGKSPDAVTMPVGEVPAAQHVI
jgi:hypothetical protein